MLPGFQLQPLLAQLRWRAAQGRRAAQAPSDERCCKSFSETFYEVEKSFEFHPDLKRLKHLKLIMHVLALLGEAGCWQSGSSLRTPLPALSRWLRNQPRVSDSHSNSRVFVYAGAL